MRFNLLFLLILLVACEKKEDFSDVKIIAHAASGLENPSAIFHDNSGEAVELALETSGCDGVELDVQLSLSNHLWFYHDQLLDTQTDQKGCVATSEDSELEKISYKTLKKEKLLSLQNLPVNFFKKRTLMLDVRHYNLCKNQEVDEMIFFNEIVNFNGFFNGQIEVIILLSNPDWLTELQNLPFQIYYSGGDYADNQQKLSLYNFDGVVIKNDYISQQQVKELHSLGKKVIIFEVRSPKGIRSALKKHPDFLVTDDLRAAVIEKY